MKMCGYTGKIGIVDLTENTCTSIPTDENLIRNYLGGRGFIIKFLYDLVPEGTDPLGEDNVLIFSAGPLNGTLSPTSGRWMVGTKSPATGFIVSGNGGGTWGAELKWAGFDAIIIKGKAKAPCYLMIGEDEIKIMAGQYLWGKDTWETEELIQREHKNSKIKVAAIGISGENMVPMASVIGEKVHHAARGGAGAVMGSKNLKALAVYGTKGVKIADPQKLLRETKKINEIIKTEAQYPVYSKYGSPKNTTTYAKIGGLTTYNGQSGVFDGFDKIEAEVYYNNFMVKRSKACNTCTMPCFHQHYVAEGKYKGVFGSGLQNSTIQCFGTKVGNDNPSALLAFHIAANKYGLDEISSGVAIAFAIECFQKKIITEKETGGLTLKWGDDDVILLLLKQMAFGTGIGKILVQGTKKAAELFGGESEDFALQVKNLEISTVDPRVFPGWALGYAVASRGADHMRAFPVWEFGASDEKDLMKIGGTTAIADRTTMEGKGKAVAFSEDARAVTDSLQMCKTFAARKVGLPETILELLNSVTGLDWSEAELLQIGERINNLERLFNLREGLKPSDDTLPKRMLKEPLPDGASKGMVINLEPMLDDYYQCRGWLRENGYPTDEKLQELGLG